MKLTIGMATYDDYAGVFMTIQSLRLYQDLTNCEIVVVDNNPGSKQGQACLALIHHVKASGIPAQYIPYTEKTGTAAPRNEVIKQANGEYVLVVDCHIMLPANEIQTLIQYLDQNPTNDLIQGPLVLDGLNMIQTHFNEIWGEDLMLGKWANAWQCHCKGTNFTTMPKITDKGEKLQYLSMSVPHQELTHCFNCRTYFPEIDFAGHEIALLNNGYTLLGTDNSLIPFEIPSQGLGLFCTKKESWLGFNPHFSGFGGEECYIHEKYRLYGRKTICLPFLKWIHRFNDGTGTSFKAVIEDKARNYVLGFKELGKPLDELTSRFSRFFGDKWQTLLNDPENFKIDCGCNRPDTGIAPAPKDYALLPEWGRNVVSNFNKHASYVTKLVESCEHVTEISRDRDIVTSLLSAKKVRSFCTAVDDIQHTIELNHKDYKVANTNSLEDIKKLSEKETTDLLLITSIFSGKDIDPLLEHYAYKVSKYIVIHAVSIYSEVGPDGGPGIYPALRKFLRQHQEWTVIHHSNEQYGLVTLTRLDELKQPIPSVVTLATNFLSSYTAYLASGMEHVSKEEYEARLLTCSTCSFRNNNRCGLCGCYIDEKARFASSECTISKWPEHIKK